jgi:predicted ATPase
MDFLLKELILNQHPIIGKIRINFNDQFETHEKNYMSIFIGPNGTCKSRILRCIIEIFREIGHVINEKKRSGTMEGSFYLKYLINNNQIEVSNMTFSDDKSFVMYPIPGDEKKTSLRIMVNGKAFKNEIIIPNKILATTMTFPDKFIAVKDKFLEQYIYLGIRNIKSPSSTGTRILNTKFTDILTAKIEHQELLESIANVLKRLKYYPSIQVNYKPKYQNIFFNKNLTDVSFNNMFDDWKNTFKGRKSEPWGRGHFLSIKNDKLLINRIVQFLNLIEFKAEKKGGKFIEFDLLNNTIFSDKYDLLFHLHKLDLLTFPDIKIIKQNSEITFSESSSGEQNILFTLLTLLANIENNSLILIDEPELSLHPNWQMQYLNILREVFVEYKNIHFIIATHSHFLISDLIGKSSKIIGLKRGDENLEIVNLPENINTYGWSAEDILYNIFNVRSSLNYYLEADLTEMLGIISNGKKDADRLEIILEKLIKLPRRENDPLQELIIEAKDYLNSIK